MDRKELKAQVIRRHHAAEQSLRSYISSGEQKHLHRFRTGIKKLRALAALVEQAAPVKLLHDTLQPIKKTFRAGGKIRDAHQYFAARATGANRSGRPGIQRKANEKTCQIIPVRKT